MRTVRELCETFKHVWGYEAKEANFAQLRNRARNELKRLCTGQDLNVDFEREATAMLTRALENYVLCTVSPHPTQYKFTSKKTANWRAKRRAIQDEV